jgi:hypothetical protein
MTVVVSIIMAVCSHFDVNLNAELSKLSSTYGKSSDLISIKDKHYLILLRGG